MNQINSLKLSNNVNFQAKINNIYKAEELIDTSPFTVQSKKLIKEMNKMIEGYWTLIRKDKIDLKTPEFQVKQFFYQASLKPLYNLSNNKQICFEVSKNKSNIVERFILDEDLNNYSYEKILKTDFGSATVKSFNTKTNKNDELHNYVNEQIEKIFPIIIRENKRPVSLYEYNYAKTL